MGLAVDIDLGLLFWSDIGFSTHGIYRANLDGSDVRPVITTGKFGIKCLDIVSTALKKKQAWCLIDDIFQTFWSQTE